MPHWTVIYTRSFPMIRQCLALRLAHTRRPVAIQWTNRWTSHEWKDVCLSRSLARVFLGIVSQSQMPFPVSKVLPWCFLPKRLPGEHSSCILLLPWKRGAGCTCQGLSAASCFSLQRLLRFRGLESPDRLKFIILV